MHSVSGLCSDLSLCRYLDFGIALTQGSSAQSLDRLAETTDV